MKVGSNQVSATAVNSMNTQESEREKQLKRIASGLSVSNTDGANLIVFDMLNSSSSELLQGVMNGNDAVGYMQVADSALQSVTSGAQQLNTLSVAMNNAALNANDKAALQSQFEAIKTSMSDAVSQASFGGKTVFGEASFSLGSSNINIDINQPNMSQLNITDQNAILDFLNQTDQTRTNIGSTINAANASMQTNLGVVVNQKASASQIGDTDIASATNELNKTLLQSNASAFALAHNEEYLAKQASRLLGI